jgi:type IV secretion system protein VirB4
MSSLEGEMDWILCLIAGALAGSLVSMTGSGAGFLLVPGLSIALSFSAFPDADLFKIAVATTHGANIITNLAAFKRMPRGDPSTGRRLSGLGQDRLLGPPQALSLQRTSIRRSLNSSLLCSPFRLNLHVSDVGHTLIFGPTGAGKSTLLAIIAAQFLRYRDARVTAFDKGRSLLALAYGVGGRHYDLGGERGIGLAPLAVLETESDLAFAGDWIESAYTLQARSAPSPRQKHEIHRALRLLREAPSHRSLTDFVTTVQDEAVRAALGPYTLDGPMGSLLDARSDGVSESSFTMFEMENLMALGERNLVPVLLALFRRFERSLTGAPALVILDEAWVMLGHPVFREKIRDWLKTLRKANCAVVLATQSLSDAVRSGLLDVLLESCPTRILLPNEEADKGGTDAVLGPRDLYTLFGLNEAEIQIIKSAVKKRHYYYTSQDGRRLFELALGRLAVAFTAVSSREDVARVLKLIDVHGEGWREAWLRERGLDPNLLDKKEPADALLPAA